MNLPSILGLGEVTILILLPLPYFLKESALLQLLHLPFPQQATGFWCPPSPTHYWGSHYRALCTAKSKRYSSSFILPDLLVTLTLFQISFYWLQESILPWSPFALWIILSQLVTCLGKSQDLNILKGIWIWPFICILTAWNNLFSCPFLKCQLFSRTLLPYSLLFFISRNHTMSLLCLKASIALMTCSPSHYLFSCPSTPPFTHSISVTPASSLCSKATAMLLSQGLCVDYSLGMEHSSFR